MNEIPFEGQIVNHRDTIQIRISSFIADQVPQITVGKWFLRNGTWIPQRGKSVCFSEETWKEVVPILAKRLGL